MLLATGACSAQRNIPHPAQVEARALEVDEFGVAATNGSLYLPTLLSSPAQPATQTPRSLAGPALITGGLGALGILIARHTASGYKADASAFPRVWLTARAVNEALFREISSGSAAEVTLVQSDAAYSADTRSITQLARIANVTFDSVLHTAGVLKVVGYSSESGTAGAGGGCRLGSLH